MRGEYSKSIEDAVRRYPALKQTVNLAKEFGVTLLKHYAKFTNKGAVCQHLWLTKTSFDPTQDWQTNQTLLGWLKNCKQYQTQMLNDRKKDIGKQVCKCSVRDKRINRKPFKSGQLINTIKDVVTHPILGVLAYTFEEDNSMVECRRCTTEIEELTVISQKS